MNSLRPAPTEQVSLEGFSDLPDFDRRVYETCLQIPRGSVSTYLQIGNALGVRCYRLIGQVLKKNPYAPTVPCHRVVNNDGRIGGFAFGIEEKINRLRAEGITVRDNQIVNFEQVIHRFA